MENIRIIIYGCGQIGKQVLAPLICKYNYDVVAYIDSNIEIVGKAYGGIPILSVDAIVKLDYDKIFIALADFDEIDKVQCLLNKYGVDNGRIVLLSSSLEYMDCFMTQRHYFVRDYAKWILSMGMSGNVAECGVFRGGFARYLNYYFYSKKLYLFDTFEGFDRRDIDDEIAINDDRFLNSKYGSEVTFENTKIDLVLKKMKYPQNVLIKKGYFPESATDVDDEFCFVNLDMDLYTPMLNALRYFWDRTVRGGCILLHDYFAADLPGVKMAVDKFEEERKIEIYKTPIGDGCSIALFK